jgi:hypothetical protein
MSFEDTNSLKLHPDIKKLQDSYTRVYLSPDRTYAIDDIPKKKTSVKQCGVYGSFKTNLIYNISGATRLGAVWTEEYRCNEFNNYAVYDFDDRM